VRGQRVTNSSVLYPVATLRPAPRVWFCAYCGRGGLAGEEPAELERACALCGFGLLLETVAEIAPAPTDAFLVVDDDFAVAAISHQAEELLGVHERSVVGRSLTDLLLPADGEPHAASDLMAAVAAATSGAAGVEPSHLRLSTIRDRSLLLHVRLGRCGPPMGALIVLEPTVAERAQLLHGGPH
jgi:PAS domain-containing protein